MLYIHDAPSVSRSSRIGGVVGMLVRQRALVVVSESSLALVDVRELVCQSFL